MHSTCQSAQSRRLEQHVARRRGGDGWGVGKMGRLGGAPFSIREPERVGHWSQLQAGKGSWSNTGERHAASVRTFVYRRPRRRRLLVRRGRGRGRSSDGGVDVGQVPRSNVGWGVGRGSSSNVGWGVGRGSSNVGWGVGRGPGSHVRGGVGRGRGWHRVACACRVCHSEGSSARGDGMHRRQNRNLRGRRKGPRVGEWVALATNGVRMPRNLARRTSTVTNKSKYFRTRSKLTQQNLGGPEHGRHDRHTRSNSHNRT